MAEKSDMESSLLSDECAATLPIVIQIKVKMNKTKKRYSNGNFGKRRDSTDWQPMGEAQMSSGASGEMAAWRANALRFRREQRFDEEESNDEAEGDAVGWRIFERRPGDKLTANLHRNGDFDHRSSESDCRCEITPNFSVVQKFASSKRDRHRDEPKVAINSDRTYSIHSSSPSSSKALKSRIFRKHLANRPIEMTAGKSGE